jgi:NhaP-type Na+/H+ or K+/H+ antiporter
MMVLLVLLGGTITGSGLLNALTWPAVAFAGLAIFVVRPLSGWIGLLGVARPGSERAVISFFGIRGLGSVYYLAYALGKEPFEAPDLLWATLGLTIVMSIVLHGVTVTPVMRQLDRASKRPHSAAKRNSPVSESALARSWARSRIRRRSAKNSR